MKKHGKLLILFLTFTILLTFSACSTTTSENKNEPEKDQRVLNAVNVLMDHWEKEFERMGIEVKHLEIINTRIINLKDHMDAEKTFGKADIFENIDYVVEFELLSNYLDTSPYFFNVYTDNWVVVYKDGTSGVSRNLLNVYRASTYSTDFSPIIASIEEFHSQYDQVLELK